MNILTMTALQLGKLIKNREIRIQNVLDSFFSNNFNKSNGYICFTKEYAYKKADEIQKKIDNGENLHILAGVPISIKDNICTKNIRTTCASNMLKHFAPTYNATVVERLENAGMIMVGKLNLDEFAMGDMGNTSIFGKCINSWNINKTTGGSSSGCASSIIANESIATIGTDTGGSIRQPSSFCSVTGFKPTYSTISRYGLISFAQQFDQIGVIGKDVADCAKIFEIINGYDKRDNTTSKIDCKIDTNNSFSIKNLNIGVCINFLEYSDKDVREKILEMIQIFKQLGANIKYINIDILKISTPTYQVLSSSIAVSSMAKYGKKYGDTFCNSIVKNRTDFFGKEVKKRLLFGAYIMSKTNTINNYYDKALTSKLFIKNEIDTAFSSHDILIAPTTPTTAVGHDNTTVDTDIFLTFANLIGVPSISVPCGITEENLPVGLQIIGKHYDDNLILNIANNFQKNTDYHLKKPSVIS